MSKLFVLVVFAILLAGMVLFAQSGTAISSAGTNIPVDRSASSTGNYMANAAITIKMTGILNE